ncbi:GNAT family N-acetyltransferase [Photobacterium sp. WH24]|uniref:GNAT family N-acetyltransferase n=1 Tax=Photobacterium sp. WH24 TaxID=2827237 RepID=UPI001C462CB4|nr:GNAT family N-acetyltransferase [Photobacterium sp. WH24]MBV7264221.1 GNAT family N-acetyltransferase [Photobacterium sp. WH24]
MVAITTERLTIRPLTAADVDFIFELYNTPGFKRFVGDKQLHTREDALNYLEASLISMYQTKGLGLQRVALKSDDTPIGICGLIKRDSLEDIDLGYGYLPGFEGKGYAVEAARSTLCFARDELSLTRLVAITDSENRRCIDLLTRLGFHYETNHETLPDGGLLVLYGIEL